MPVEVLFRANPATNICAWIATEGEKCQVTTYLETLARNNDSDAGAMVHLLDQTSQHGPPSNPQKFRFLQGLGKGLVESKARGGTRILAFVDAPHRRIVCTHAIPKLKDKRFNREIALANQIKEAYFLDQAMEESGYVN